MGPMSWPCYPPGSKNLPRRIKIGKIVGRLGNPLMFLRSLLLRPRRRNGNVQAVAAQVVVQEIDAAVLAQLGEDLADRVPPDLGKVMRIGLARLLILPEPFLKSRRLGPGLEALLLDVGGGHFFDAVAFGLGDI